MGHRSQQPSLEWCCTLTGVWDSSGRQGLQLNSISWQSRFLSSAQQHWPHRQSERCCKFRVRKKVTWIFFLRFSELVMCWGTTMRRWRGNVCWHRLDCIRVRFVQRSQASASQANLTTLIYGSVVHSHTLFQSVVLLLWTKINTSLDLKGHTYK